MQDQVLKAVGRRWITSEQVSKALKIDRGSATKKLNKLAQYKFIKREPCKITIKSQEHIAYRYRKR